MFEIIPFELPISENESNSLFKGEFPVHRIFVIDCSGSMSDDLPHIRKELNNKLPTLIRPQDYCSLIWFSGKSEYGVLQEHINLNDLNDLSNLQSVIDRYLRPVGCTGFVEPLHLAKELGNKYTEQAQVYFLSDGGENQWSEEESLNAFKELELPLICIEYKYYCDRKFFTNVVNETNCTSIFSENFSSLKPTLENCFISIPESKHVSLPSNYDVFTLIDGTVKRYISKEGVVKVPINGSGLYTITDTNDICTSDQGLYYLGMAYALKYKKDDLFITFLKLAKDVYFGLKYSNCFSKQDQSRLEEECIQAYLNSNKRGILGYKEDVMPADDVYTILDLLKGLESDKKARFYPYKMGEYKRISKEVKKDKFVANKDLGCEFSLVWNNSRANCSLGCIVYGHTIEEKDDCENIVSTKTYRNYTIIKDGIKNIEILPLSCSEQLFNELKTNGCIDETAEWASGKVNMVNIKDLPVVNRVYVKQNKIESTTFLKHCVHRLCLQASIKYAKYVLKKLEVEESTDGELEYGSRTKKEGIRDFYEAPELIVKISGCSSLPTVNDKLLDKFSKRKTTLVEGLMLKAYNDLQSVGLEECKKYIELCKVELMEINKEIETIKFAILVANIWFTDLEVEESNKTIDFLWDGEIKQFNCEIITKLSKVYMD